jgi:predicted amidohydrolase YtcJ
MNKADLVLRGGVIAAVGTDAQIDGLTGPGTQVIELAGRMLLPGFIDAHVHASAAGLERLRCDLSGAHGLDDYLTIVRRYAEASPDAGWITGCGWAALLPGTISIASFLTGLFLSNRDHHAAWVNSRALELAGVTASTPDPADGRTAEGITSRTSRWCIRRTCRGFATWVCWPTASRSGRARNLR